MEDSNEEFQRDCAVTLLDDIQSSLPKDWATNFKLSFIDSWEQAPKSGNGNLILKWDFSKKFYSTSEISYQTGTLILSDINSRTKVREIDASPLRMPRRSETSKMHGPIDNPDSKLENSHVDYNHNGLSVLVVLHCDNGLLLFRMAARVRAAFLDIFHPALVIRFGRWKFSGKLLSQKGFARKMESKV